MGKSAILHSSFFIIHFILLAVIAYCLSGLSNQLPQYASGGDVLSVAFGDARSVLSRAAYHKADSYFHGGIDMDCHQLDDHHDEESPCHHDHSTHHPSLNFSFSLFPFSFYSWINVHVRAPREHHHLEGEKAVELMPWFWAAVKSDPHNEEAWDATWYAASHIMKDRALAGRVIAEAVAKNPNSAALALTEGRHLYDKGKGDCDAAQKAFERAKRLAGKDSQVYEFAERYLKDMEKRRGK